MSEDELYDNDDFDAEEENEEGDFEDTIAEKVLPPNEFKRSLQACTTCYFILSKTQWNDYKSCPNCDEDLLSRKPTDKFKGITCVTNPSKSWQTTRMRIVKGARVKIPGAYASSMPEDY